MDGAVPVDVGIVVPVYNEAPQLAESITALRAFLDESFPSGRSSPSSTTPAPTTPTGGEPAGRSMPGVAAVHLDAQGPGPRLRAAWSTSEAPVVAYMDVDLSTSLEALLPLVAPLLSGHRDVAIGSASPRRATWSAGPTAR